VGIQFVGIAHDDGNDAESLERVAHRTEVGAAGIDQRQPHHNTPLVLGNWSPSRRIACRSARATTLKQASTLWWSLSPCTRRCRFRPPASHSERKKCGTSSVGRSPTRSRRNVPSNTK